MNSRIQSLISVLYSTMMTEIFNNSRYVAIKFQSDRPTSSCTSINNTLRLISRSGCAAGLLLPFTTCRSASNKRDFLIYWYFSRKSWKWKKLEIKEIACEFSNKNRSKSNYNRNKLEDHRILRFFGKKSGIENFPNDEVFLRRRNLLLVSDRNVFESREPHRATYKSSILLPRHGHRLIACTERIALIRYQQIRVVKVKVYRPSLNIELAIQMSWHAAPHTLRGVYYCCASSPFPFVVDGQISSCYTILKSFGWIKIAHNDRKVC